MRFAPRCLLAIATLPFFGTSSVAGATSSAAASVDENATTADTETSNATRVSSSKTPWIDRWKPERHMVELGVYGGAFFPARDIELFEPSFDLPRQGAKSYRTVGPTLGGRLGYFPIRYFGIELEGGWSPTRTDVDDQAVNIWTARGHVVGQLGWWSVTPFVLAGAGAIAVNSPRAAVGNDVDPALYSGLGVKFFLNRWLVARIEGRHIITSSRGVASGVTNSFELLAGLGVTFGRKPKAAPASLPSDRDHDGFPDLRDACPDVPGVAPDGCPLPDRDGDGILDVDDACPDEFGVAPDGCPADRDGDGIPDDLDACPDEPGIPPDGCPDPDPDGDGILGAADLCPDEPETFNEYEDEDGCPDEVPEDVTRFTGTIEGVFFEVNKAVLQPQSKTTLDAAVDVLERYPNVRFEISGHSDSTGPRELNMELSQARADAVRTYLVERGVDPNRLETRGAGPDEPIDTNNTKDGRSKNRRIEFRPLR